MKVLVTGGAGFIGSHACVALKNAGFTPIILDNFQNSRKSVVPRLNKILNSAVEIVEGDVRDREVLNRIFETHEIAAVMHFAGQKAVGESSRIPLEYYDVNVNGTLVLLRAMRQAGVPVLIFSSSATVYGNAKSVPIRECAGRSALNPYARTKLMAEEILQDLCQSDDFWRVACLRYFNPAGADESGLFGEDPLGIPNNLIPYIAQVASGKRARLQVFGNDYPTVDGTGVRDYIHVMDLVDGHVSALHLLLEGRNQLLTLNLGTGVGYSVLQLVKEYESVTGRIVPLEFANRRLGDVAESWADPTLAFQRLGWKALRSLSQMCHDSWHWQRANPDGYPRDN